MYRILNVLVTSGLYMAVVSGLGMSLIVFGAVIMRYLISQPLRGYDEFVALLFSAWILLAWPYLFIRGRNICVSLVSETVSGFRLRLVRAAADLVSICILIVLGCLSAQYAYFSYEIGALTDVARLPEAPWAAMMPIAFFLSALAVLVMFGRNRSR